MAKYILQKSGKKSENEYVKGEKKNEEIKSQSTGTRAVAYALNRRMQFPSEDVNDESFQSGK